MIRPLSVGTLLGLLLSASAMAQTSSSPTAPAEELGASRATRPLNKQDRTFIHEAAIGGLAEVDAEAKLVGGLGAQALDVVERRRAIEMRLAQAQHVHVGAVEDGDKMLRTGHGAVGVACAGGLLQCTGRMRGLACRAGRPCP